MLPGFANFPVITCCRGCEGHAFRFLQGRAGRGGSLSTGGGWRLRSRKLYRAIELFFYYLR